MVCHVFGSSSEQVDRKQLELLLQLAAGDAPAESVKVQTKKEVKVQLRLVAVRKDRAPRLSEHLPVVEDVIEPEPVKQQPEQWRCIGQGSASSWILNLPVFYASVVFFVFGRSCVLTT